MPLLAHESIDIYRLKEEKRTLRHRASDRACPCTIDLYNVIIPPPPPARTPTVRTASRDCRHFRSSPDRAKTPPTREQLPAFDRAAYKASPVARIEGIKADKRNSLTNIEQAPGVIQIDSMRASDRRSIRSTDRSIDRSRVAGGKVGKAAQKS